VNVLFFVIYFIQNMHFILTSERLYLRPLTYAELKVYVESPTELLSKTDFAKKINSIDPELKETVIKEFYPYFNNIYAEFLFHTLWLIIIKDTLTVAGSICFHGEPVDGAVELGYGIDETFRNRGYMKEAIGLIVEWAQKRSDINKVVAVTSAENIASQKVLQANGFNLFDIAEDNMMGWYVSTK